MSSLRVTSRSFEENGMIPKKFTCDGDDISPHLKWEGAPESTKSFALLCDDPDAPVGDWVHWIVFNIPSNFTEFTEGIKIRSVHGAMEGTNDFRRLHYGGPCPPGGMHRYYFRVYALDTVLDAKEGITKKQLLVSMDRHIVAKGELMGRYTRSR